MVITDLDTLRAETGHPAWAETSTGDRITAEQARRLACQASIIPVVLGGKGEILDLGRARRFFIPTPTQGHGAPRPPLHRPRLRHARRLLRSPPLQETLVQRRQDQPRRRQTAVSVPPSPSPRPCLDHHPPSQRINDLPPADVTSSDFLARHGAMTFTARVNPVLRVRIERWRRARELSGDQRAGSVVHRDILEHSASPSSARQRMALCRRRAVSWQSPWRSSAVVGDVNLHHRSAVIGAYIAGVPMLIGSLVVSATGTAFKQYGRGRRALDRCSALRPRSSPRLASRSMTYVSGTETLTYILVGLGGDIWLSKPNGQLHLPGHAIRA